MGQIKLINRELSWLSFNARVLQEAADRSLPSIERIRFLGIFSNNLDEFFRVRVATLKRLVMLGGQAKEVFGGKPDKILNQIHKKVLEQQTEFDLIYTEIIKDLEKHGIFLINEQQLNEPQREYVMDYFRKKVRPALVPIMFHPSNRQVPILKDKSIYLAIKLSNAQTKKRSLFSLVEVPSDILPRFIVLPKEGRNNYVILLDDIIRANLKEVFTVFQFDSIEGYTIKLTRDAELDIDNDVAKSMIEKISKSIKQRQKGEPVRFVYDSAMPDDLLRFVMRKLKLTKTDNLIPGGRYHNFKDYMKFPHFDKKSLEYPPMPPAPHPALQNSENILAVVKKQDILLHVPYQTFDHVIDLLREAAIDPQVVSIRVTLYRVAEHSLVVNALINAAKNGKDVKVVVELQARFDEEHNIYWANRMQEEGVEVIFGVPGLKVHSKVCLITRKEHGRPVLYSIVSTGNFHESTAKVYSDLILFTAHKEIGQELARLFSFFEKNYKTFKFNHLIVSPFYLRKKLKLLIHNEMKNAKAGKEAWMILKLNSLVDEEIIKKLYDAGKAGVKIQLIVRGICSLVPGVPGFSENISAISIVDRFLEHSRIFIFANGGNPEYFLSSADFMTRNIDYRIEVVCPVYDSVIKQELKTMIDLQLQDNVKARMLDQKGKNEYISGNSGQKVRSQSAIYEMHLAQLTSEKNTSI